MGFNPETPRGVTISSSVEDKTLILLTGCEPIAMVNPSVTVFPGSKPSPYIVSSVPPASGPHLTELE